MSVRKTRFSRPPRAAAGASDTLPFALAGAAVAAVIALAEPAMGAPQGLEAQLAAALAAGTAETEGPTRSAGGLDLSLDRQPANLETRRAWARQGARELRLDDGVTLTGVHRLELRLYPDDRRFGDEK
jgi:hypothetical protein